MGQYISASMIVGAHASHLDVSDEDLDEFDGCIYEWCEEHGLTIMPEHYDAPLESSYIGFPIADIPAKDINSEWVELIQELASGFKQLTKIDGVLIGTQNVY